MFRFIIKKIKVSRKVFQKVNSYKLVFTFIIYIQYEIFIITFLNISLLSPNIRILNSVFNIVSFNLL